MTKRKKIIISSIILIILGIIIFYLFSIFNERAFRNNLLELGKTKNWNLIYGKGSRTFYFLSIGGKSTVAFGNDDTFSLPYIAYPSLSPDRKQVVYESDDLQSEKKYLIISDLNGNTIKKLLESADGFKHINWSPRGDKIAYLEFEYKGDCRDNYRLKTVDLEGNIKDITDTISSRTQPHWSSDGKRIVFASQDGYVTISDLESGNLNKIAKGDAPSWSPDGRILYREYNKFKPYPENIGNDVCAYDTDNGSNYYIVNSDGSNKQFFFNGSMKLSDFSTIWLMGRNPHNFTNDVIFSPDGKYFLYSKYFSFIDGLDEDVYIMEVATKKRARIASGILDSMPQTYGSISWAGEK